MVSIAGQKRIYSTKPHAKLMRVPPSQSNSSFDSPKNRSGKRDYRSSHDQKKKFRLEPQLLIITIIIIIAVLVSYISI